MEVHSTILWHLKKEVALCHLAKRAVELDRTSVYACCVVGNCFSLQKEHDTALKFFQRAIQLQPDFAYAYTLSGHEYSANDDFEKVRLPLACRLASTSVCPGRLPHALPAAPAPPPPVRLRVPTMAADLTAVVAAVLLHG